MISESWSKSEKKHARALFDLALDREFTELMERINTTKIETPDEVWNLHDMLGKKRKAMNRKYDYRYSQLIFVFVQLTLDEYLSLEELSVLGEEKLGEIKKMVEGKYN